MKKIIVLSRFHSNELFTAMKQVPVSLTHAFHFLMFWNQRLLLCPLGKVAGDMGEGAHPILVAIQKFSGEKNYCSESVSLE